MRKKASPFRTVTFRLTFGFGAIFGLLSLAVFLFVYTAMVSALGRRSDEELSSKAREFQALYRTHGIEALRSEFRREAASQGKERVFFRLLSPEGKARVSSDLGAWKGLPKEIPLFRGGTGGFATLSLPGRSHQVRVLSRRLPGGDILEVGATLEGNEALVRKYRETFEIALAVMLVCGGLAGWFLARWAMSGVERVTEAALRIGREDLGLRVPPGKEGREIENLALAFNGMLERIQALVEELKEVTDNVAHDLRGPITRIRGLAESSLLSGEEGDSWREAAGAVVEESDRLVEMINTMLEISRAEAGVLEIARAPVDLGEIVAAAGELFQPLAEEKGIDLESSYPEEALLVPGDKGRLQRAVANLLDNAIKFTPAGGRVELQARREEGKAKIQVKDTGSGIDPFDLPRIFERFYRGEKSRSSEGNGLGLSLARAVVRAHGGEIEVESAPGKGSAFTILLPLLGDGR